jgi:hypothetical protein
MQFAVPTAPHTRDNELLCLESETLRGQLDAADDHNKNVPFTHRDREREREREPKASEESGQTWSTLWITHGTASHSGRPFCRKWSRRRIYIVLIVSASRVSRLFGASGASFNLSSATCKINSSTEAEDGVIERRDRVPRLASTGIPTAKPCEQRWPVLDGELFSEP